MAVALAPMFASTKALSRRLPCRSESTTAVPVWSRLPRLPKRAAESSVSPTVWLTLNSSAPAIVPAAENQNVR